MSADPGRPSAVSRAPRPARTAPARAPARARARRALPALYALAALLAAHGGAAAQCLDCHADAEFLASVLPDPARPVAPLVVDEASYGRSVHGAMDCSECHMGFEETPHVEGEAMTFGCTGCHADAAEALGDSVHGASMDGAAVACGSCHGVHDVLPPDDRASHLHPLEVWRTCGRCHFEADVDTAGVEALLREPYTDDAHARGILVSGLAVSATCVSCHGGHGIRPKGDSESRVARARVEQVCASCHVGVAEDYRESVHHKLAIEGDGGTATCTDCHLPHEPGERGMGFEADAVVACSRCHEERAGTFRETYHGKARALGDRGRVATCADCHGNHAILPAEDPASPVHPDRIVGTCAQCHEDAHPGFASYAVHADPRDAEGFPELHLAWSSMRTLLVVTLVLGMLHAVLWLIRSSAEGGWKRHQEQAPRYVRRWPTLYVVYHAWLASCVLLLAATGLPLHYAGERWASRLMNALGGPVAAGWVHRVAAVSLALLYVVYVVHLSHRVWVRRERGLFAGPNTMLPRWKDVQDLLGTVRWFLWLGPRPRYDRWTYWEKFDFWAAFWGLVVIGLSGLMLWFPEAVTLIVPGWVLNAAVVIHGHEAQLVIAFIFTVHAFHANLRPDKFPLDTAFLTGRIPEHEFRADRPLEYERAQRQGTLDALLAPPPPRGLRRAAWIVGLLGLAAGFFFLAVMLAAALTE
jgi:cytochrome b subunit of formate dehydrogenase/nitrate/TMAO reductase-like tetraheme cytochrome c subunit